MRKLLFIALLFSPSILFAEGPLFDQKDPAIKQEFENVYQDIRSKPHYSNPGFTGTTGYFAVSTSTSPSYVLQSVQCSVIASSASSAATYVDTNLTCSITPSPYSTNSKIRISVTGELASNSGTAGTTTAATLARNGTNLFGTSGFAVAEAQTSGVTVAKFPASLAGWYDTPPTRTAQTYSVQIKALSGTTQAIWCNSNQTCILLLEEIGQ